VWRGCSLRRCCEYVARDPRRDHDRDPPLLIVARLRLHHPRPLPPPRHHPAARYRGQVEGEGEVYDARDDTEAWCESVGWKPLCSRKSRNDHVLLHRVPEEDGGQDAGGDYLVMIEVMVALIPKT
jgi:hypothetical protein